MTALNALLAGRPAPSPAASGEPKVARYFSAQEYDRIVEAHAALTELADAAEAWLSADTDPARVRVQKALARVRSGR